jgi:hypothetical protein
MSCCNDILALCRRALAWTVLAGTLASPAWAQTRAALLVGVADYPASSGAKPLPGTANDVELMRTILLRTGFRSEDITVLADKQPGAAAPTRDNILGALRRMAAGAKPGDYYYLHFSGHGSQQPEDPKARARRPEPDGLNEIFLPIDIGKWDGARATVVNAIVNRELDEILDQFLARGAFVWAVFDACHSASLMRGGPDDEVTLREVDPQALGIPALAMDQAAAGAVTTRGQPDAPMGALSERNATPGKSGGFVAFYAAQTTESAPEMAMPGNLVAGHPDKKRHGVLTYTLAEALATNPQASYRQVSQFILSRYSSQYISNKPTPIFTGTHLDAPVFGRTLASPVRQWQITRTGGKLGIPAGRLAQLSDGAVLAVMGNPAAPTDQALGQLRIVSAGLFASQLAAAADADDRTIAEDKIPEGAYARLVRPAIDLQLRVAQPTFSARTAEMARRKVEAAVQAVRKDPPAGSRIEWLPVGRPAEIRLHEEDDQLWLLPASGALMKSGPSKTLSIKLDRSDAEFATLLSDSLARIAKAVNLIRVAEQMPGGGGVASVDVKVELLPQAAGAPAKALTSVGARLRGGDKVGFTITNRSRTPVDVTILYIDSQYGIEPIFPGGAENNRIEPGAVLRAGPGGIEPITLGDDTTGTERLLVIVSSTVAQGERIDYTYLAQPRLDTTRSRGASSNLLDLFNEAAFGVTTRSAARTRDEQTAMQVYTWEVRKR